MSECGGRVTYCKSMGLDRGVIFMVCRIFTCQEADMIRHLRMVEETEWVDGEMMTFCRYANPDDPDNWIDDPCSFCGGESVPSQCPGDGQWHHHGAIHPPHDSGVSGYWYLCSNPDCQELARAAWASQSVRNG